jgi:3,4-dihydroxy-9,10-secoandrosta-1,3,5(10)-triene-9,17-dione 4,5-dioxygenase
MGTEDIEGWRRFGTELLGLMAVEGERADSLYFRMDDFPPRLVVSPAAQAGLQAIGLQVQGPEDLDELAAAVEATGTKVSRLEPGECQERRVTDAVRFDDPAGNVVELWYGPALPHRPAILGNVSGFITGDQGMGHVVVTAPDGPAAYDFYTKTLGFKGRNTLRLPGPPDADGTPRWDTLWFLGCNPRHHTVGVLPLPGPGRLVHFMIESASLDDVGRAWDRVERLDVPVMQTLGRHTNDRMVSFYVLSPDGFAVEFGFDGLRVDHDEPVYEITDGAFWGHKFVNPPKL